MWFSFYTPIISVGRCTRVFKPALAFQLHKKLLMLLCGSKDDGTCVLVLAGWDGAQEMLDRTGQPKGQLRRDTSPR